MNDIADEMRKLADEIGVTLENLGRANREVAIRSPSRLEGDTGIQRALQLSLEANRLMLNAMTATMMGECRMERPYRPLRPVIDESGAFRWCCTHSPPHCR